MDAMLGARARFRQRGQAMPIGIAAILFTTILTLTLFNTGQVTSEKMRLTNTADAAAYSGLVWQARGLNFQSYANRAMVANQVSIAQVVSLVSWSKYLETSSTNLDYVIGWIPPVKPYTEAFKRASVKLNEIMNLIAEVAVPILDELLDVLSKAQGAVHIATTLSTQEVVRKVVARNDPRYEITLLGGGFLIKNGNDWGNFTKSYKSEDDLLRKAKVIEDSRDGFTANRGWSQTMLNVGIIKVKLVKGGQTKLINKKKADDEGDTGFGSSGGGSDSGQDWEWKGKDTLSVHLKWKCIKKGRIKTCREELPVGWGAAYVSTNNEDLDECAGEGGGWFSAFWDNDCPPWSENQRADILAENEKDEIDANYGGIRDYRDIADSDEKDPRLPLVVEVRVIDNQVRTSSKVKGIGSPTEAQASRNGITTGMFGVGDDFAEPVAGGGPEIAAISKGEVYFRRPVARQAGRYGAQDSLDEFGNLFNPYWDVHLVNADGERIAAWASKGVIDFIGLVEKGGGGKI